MNMKGAVGKNTCFKNSKYCYSQCACGCWASRFPYLFLCLGTPWTFFWYLQKYKNPSLKTATLGAWNKYQHRHRAMMGKAEQVKFSLQHRGFWGFPLRWNQEVPIPQCPCPEHLGRLSPPTAPLFNTRGVTHTYHTDSSPGTKWNVKASLAFKNFKCFGNSYASPVNIISESLNSQRKTFIVLLARFKYFTTSHKDISQNMMRNDMHWL